MRDLALLATPVVAIGTAVAVLERTAGAFMVKPFFMGEPPLFCALAALVGGLIIGPFAYGIITGVIPEMGG